MPFVQRSGTPDSLGEGRQVRGISYEADTGANWVGVANEVGVAETEISEATYRQALADNDAHNAAIPPPPPPPPDPLQAILDKDEEAITAGDLKTLTLALARRRL